MTEVPVVPVVLTVAGAGILAVSLNPTTRIIRDLPPGSVRTQWKVLRGFIVFFIAGYLSYLALFSSERGASPLLVSSIFFLGACFVLLVCLLAYGTVRDVRRIVTLETENITDPLMEIFNRRHLDRRLEEEFSRARRYGFPLSVLMLDIDHFKRINDVHGHASGDAVLKGIGALLKDNIRNVDIPARFGGEEAVILLPHTGEAEAAILAERIRKKIEAHLFQADAAAPAGVPLRCTVSIGIACVTAECANGGLLVQMADAALYKAKQEGRNRVSLFRRDKEATAPSN